MLKKLSELKNEVRQFQNALEKAEAVLIGAGAGLSTSAGFVYNGERFQRYFADFEEAYGFHDMYSGGFYPYGTWEEYWAYWSRYIFINRYMDAPKPVYQELYQLVKDKDYFVLTTNVDHCFQKAGFDKQRLFYTQGDYGLWQCSKPCHNKTYGNEAVVRQMVKGQGFVISPKGNLETEPGNSLEMAVPSQLVPHCPVCGAPMTMNLRADDTFVQDGGWYRAFDRYGSFIRSHKKMPLLYLELGVGNNTPGIIKYPFWQMTYQNPKATYACINQSGAFAPDEIKGQSICIQDDIENILKQANQC